MDEPNFDTEKQLEDAIAAVAQEIVEGALVLRGFGLDIAVFPPNLNDRSPKLFEVKAFSEHHGRCGFGSQRGEGNQIRLLFDLDRGEPRSSSDLRLFDPTIRWILGHRTMPPESARFLFFTCEEAAAAASGGVRPGKQNNLRLSAFGGRWITWTELEASIERFVSGQ